MKKIEWQEVEKENGIFKRYIKHKTKTYVKVIRNIDEYYAVTKDKELIKVKPYQNDWISVDPSISLIYEHVDNINEYDEFVNVFPEKQLIKIHKCHIHSCLSGYSVYINNTLIPCTKEGKSLDDRYILQIVDDEIPVNEKIINELNNQNSNKQIVWINKEHIFKYEGSLGGYAVWVYLPEGYKQRICCYADGESLDDRYIFRIRNKNSVAKVQ